MTTYTYPITAFPNDVVNHGKLDSEITDSSISPSVSASTLHDFIFSLFFDGTLSGGEQTELDGLVAVHDGVPYTHIKTLVAERVDTFTSTASAYTTVLLLSAPALAAGEYRLSWFIVYGIDSDLVNFRMRVQQNHLVTKVEYVEEVPNADPNERIPRSGFIPLSLTSGDHHWDIDCGKEQGGEESWKVFKAFLELRRVD